MTQPPPSFHLSDFENLQEDLVLLQTSMQQRRVDPARAQAQCVEILGAVAEITQEQQLQEYAAFVQNLVGFVTEVDKALASHGESFWALTLDVLDELLAALEMADAGLKIDEDAMKRHIVAFQDRLGAMRESAGNGETDSTESAGSATEMVNFEMAEDAAEAGDGGVALEEADTATESKAVSVEPAAEEEREKAQSLLQRAAEAAAAGRDDEAQTLAARATELLAAQVRERKAAQLKELRNQLHVIVSEVEAAEGELADAESQCEQLHASAAQAQQLRDDAEASYLQQAESLEQAKAELEEIERRMAELQETQRTLMTQFEEALPAKEASERAFEHARDEAASLEAAMREEEARMADIRASLEDGQARRERIAQQLEVLERELQ